MSNELLLPANVAENPSDGIEILDTSSIESENPATEFTYLEREYSFEIPFQEPQVSNSLTLMEKLYSGEAKLAELTDEQLDTHIVNLMRYQTMVEFPDDSVDRNSIEILSKRKQEEEIVVGSTTYTDEFGAEFLAEIIADDADVDSIRSEALYDTMTTHQGMIRNTLAALVQRKVNPAHDWKDEVHYNKEEMEMTLSYVSIYRATANSEVPLGEESLPLWARDTHKFEMSALSTGDVVVGEKHLRLIANQNYDNLLESRLRSLDNPLVIVENDLSGENLNFTSPLPTFMHLTKEYALAQGIELVALDDNEIRDTLTLWEGYGFSRDEVEFVAWLSKIDGAYKANPEVSWKDWLQALPAEQEDSAKELILQYLSLSINYPEEISNLIKSFSIDLNSRIREQAYLDKIAELRDRNPDKQLFVVVGNAHRDNISLLLSGGSPPKTITPIESEEFSSQVRAVQNLIEPKV